MISHRLLAGGALAALLALPAAAAPPAAAPPGSGFRSTGTLVMQANLSGSPLDVGGNVVVYRRGGLYRIDLLSLAFPGAGSAGSAALGALLPAGGATVIYDGNAGTISAYSNANHTYYAAPPKPPASGAAPAAAPPTTAADPLSALASLTRRLHDVQRASIQLTGHSTTNGHPTDDLDVLLKRQVPGKPAEDYHAQLALAEDLDGFPVRILASSTPATPQSFGGSMRLDLTAVTRDTPDEAAFAIPAGYTRVGSIGDILKPRT